MVSWRGARISLSRGSVLSREYFPSSWSCVGLQSTARHIDLLRTDRLPHRLSVVTYSSRTRAREFVQLEYSSSVRRVMWTRTEQVDWRWERAVADDADELAVDTSQHRDLTRHVAAYLDRVSTDASHPRVRRRPYVQTADRWQCRSNHTHPAHHITVASIYTVKR